MKKIALVDADYDGKVAGIIKMLKNEETFKDYNYEGSAIRSIIRVLGMFSSDASLYANLLFNERFAHTAEIRKNVVSASQNLGYRPRSITAAKLLGKVTANLEDEVQQPILRKTTIFLGVKDGQTINFSPKQDYIGTYSSGVAVFGNVELLQGTWKSFSYDLSEHTGIFSVVLDNSESIDSNTLKVFVDENGVLTEYEQFKNILQLKKENKIFFLDYNTDGQLVIELGDGNISYKPLNGIVYVQYINTLGAEGNEISKVTPIGVVEGSSDITFISSGLSVGGANEESVESIRKSAQGAFGSGGLAVVASQYVPICKTVFPSYEFSVWGGEKNTPPKNGYVMICGVNTLGQNMTSEEIDVLFDHLKTVNVGSITPKYVQSTKTAVDINLTAYWTPSVTSLDSSGVSAKLTSDTKGFFYENLVGFNRTLDPFELLENVKRNNFFNSGFVSLGLRKQVKLLAGNNTVFLRKTVKPNTLSILGLKIGVSEIEVKDDGLGNILINSSISGSIDYEKGVLIVSIEEKYSIGDTSVYFGVDGVDQSYVCEGNETLILGQISINPVRK